MLYVMKYIVSKKIVLEFVSDIIIVNMDISIKHHSKLQSRVIVVCYTGI